MSRRLLLRVRVCCSLRVIDMLPARAALCMVVADELTLFVSRCELDAVLDPLIDLEV